MHEPAFRTLRLVHGSLAGSDHSGDNFREHVFNFAKHRRPEHYKLIVERVGAGAPLGDSLGE